MEAKGREETDYATQIVERLRDEQVALSMRMTRAVYQEIGIPLNLDDALALFAAIDTAITLLDEPSSVRTPDNQFAIHGGGHA